MEKTPKKQKKILDYLIDFGLILCLLYMCFQFGKFAGRDDAYMAGFISGYDYYYKGAFEVLQDSLREVRDACIQVDSSNH